MQRRLARLSANVMIATVLTGLVGWLIWNNSSFSKISAIATVAEGEVEFRLDGYNHRDRVLPGMSFGENTELSTPGDARAALSIKESAVRLGSKSSIHLDKLTRRHTHLSVGRGEVYFRIAEPDNRTVRVESSWGVYEAQNAAFRIIDSQGEEGIEVFYGEVKATSGSTSTQVTAGQSYFKPGRMAKLEHAKLAADEFLKWNSAQDRENFADKLGALHDLEPPELQIHSPANGIITSGESVRISGTTEPDAKILINGRKVENHNGQFAAQASLDMGENIITIEASDKAGNKTGRTILVRRTSEEATQTTQYSPPPYGTPVLEAAGIGRVSWSLDGSAPYGFVLVWSENPEPSYPDSNHQRHSNTTNIGNIKGEPGTYYVRVCAYYEGHCINYSNQLTVKLPPQLQN